MSSYSKELQGVAGQDAAYSDAVNYFVRNVKCHLKVSGVAFRDDKHRLRRVRRVLLALRTGQGSLDGFRRLLLGLLIGGGLLWCNALDVLRLRRGRRSTRDKFPGRRWADILARVIVDVDGRQDGLVHSV